MKKSLKQKRKKKVLTLYLSSKMFKDKVPASLRKRVDSCLREHARDMNYHFKKDKWPLDISFYIDEVISSILGSRHVRDYILSKFLEKTKQFKTSINSKPGINLVISRKGYDKN